MIDTCYVGDVRDGLRAFIAAGVRAQTCVTSPPYWGLRDYGVSGQLGLEATPGEFTTNMVDVFRLVRAVLADDGTLWLNMGDSYSQRAIGDIKAKDLHGMPWRLAMALQQPYYTGRIKSPLDRVWLAAMIDGEGCMFVHKRKEGQSNGQGYTRKNATFAPGLEVANTSIAIIERCIAITGAGSVCRQDKDRRQTLYRWNVRSNECRWIVEEVYPYLVAKQQQARLLLGCPSSGERADAAHQGLILLHNGRPTDVDFAAPEAMFRPGWYLRSDVIWAKANPMPESINDRPTKSHEYLFLLSKRERYYYDADAITEEASPDTHARNAKKERIVPAGWAGGAAPHTAVAHQTAKAHRKMAGAKPREVAGAAVGAEDRGHNCRVKNNASFDAAMAVMPPRRNKRTVWTIPSEPFPDAHFATFPRALVEPCILAGSRVGDVVLDPFMGSGTTAQVAQSLGRHWIGTEINPAYVSMQATRTAQSAFALAAEFMVHDWWTNGLVKVHETCTM